MGENFNVIDDFFRPQLLWDISDKLEIL